MNDLRAPRAIKQYDYEHQKIVPIDVSCEESTSGRNSPKKENRIVQTTLITDRQQSVYVPEKN